MFYIKNTFYFLKYVQVRYVKNLFTNIQKQQNISKLAYFLENLQTSRANNSRILRVKDAKFFGQCFYLNISIQGEFQICISVPLTEQYFPYRFCGKPNRNLHQLYKIHKKYYTVGTYSSFSICLFIWLFIYFRCISMQKQVKPF